MTAFDRISKLQEQDKVTGIDFVYVHAEQTTLDVFFFQVRKHDDGSSLLPLRNPPIGAIRIYSPSGGETRSEVPVKNVDWITINGREVLRITTDSPGDFSIYRLHIDDPRMDGYFNDISFTFKANCPSELDCRPKPHECAPESAVDFPVDYAARDFWSFRRALLDFAAERYPKWQDRLEADVGNMMVEVMSALGDEFAYYQDRIAREAYLETATQRRSLRRHAGLVDYHIHDGLGATTWLDFSVDPAGVIQAGALVTDPTGRINFEVGRGLKDFLPSPSQFPLDPDRNSLHPYQWDEDDVCLPAGAVELYVNGPHAEHLQPDYATSGGRWVLLTTKSTKPEVPDRAWMVQLIAVENTFDTVQNPPLAITRLQWDASQATPFEFDLSTLEVHGNMVPATAGQTYKKSFTIGDSIDEVNRPSAIERQGSDARPVDFDDVRLDAGEVTGCSPPRTAVTYLFSLPDSDTDDLVFLGPAPDQALPEIYLEAIEPPEFKGEWTCRRELLGTYSAQSNERVFCLDDGFWRRIVGYHRVGKEIIHQDYAAGSGKTIRFGDGEFGQVPSLKTVFEVTYRLGGGTKSNVPAGTLTNYHDPLVVTSRFVKRVTNPLPVTDGVDPETPEQVRRQAPDAFRAVTFRAVRPEDYAEAVERLPWVQRAGASFRWTGSWLTAFATPDPIGAFNVTLEQRTAAVAQLDRFRQAGRPAYLLDPRYANLDLVIEICVASSAFKGEVKEKVLEALFGVKGVRPKSGFFSPDNFTFGTPLERSRLEAAIQEVEGVKSVEDILIRRRAWFGWRVFSELTYSPVGNELIRVENNPSFPERGSVTLDMRGGA